MASDDRNVFGQDTFLTIEYIKAAIEVVLKIK